MEGRLMRSRTDAMLGGVCGGLGKFLNIDASFIRIFFMLFTFAGGSGVLIYLVLWIILPREDQVYPAGFPANGDDFKTRAGNMRDEFNEAIRKPNPNGAKLFGIALIILGGILLVQRLDIPWLGWLRGEVVWPALLVLGGVALLVRTLRRE